jgi:hypothetical protein
LLASPFYNPFSQQQFQAMPAATGFGYVRVSLVKQKYLLKGTKFKNKITKIGKKL